MIRLGGSPSCRHTAFLGPSLDCSEGPGTTLGGEAPSARTCRGEGAAGPRLLRAGKRRGLPQRGTRARPRPLYLVQVLRVALGPGGVPLGRPAVIVQTSLRVSKQHRQDIDFFR